MELKAKFKVVLMDEVREFLKGISEKAYRKIIYNIRKSTFSIDPELFKKLDGTEIWEFRTKYDGIQYRLLSFWDKDGEDVTLVVSTSGFVKKTKKTPQARWTAPRRR